MVPHLLIRCIVERHGCKETRLLLRIDVSARFRVGVESLAADKFLCFERALECRVRGTVLPHTHPVFVILARVRVDHPDVGNAIVSVRILDFHVASGAVIRVRGGVRRGGRAVKCLLGGRLPRGFGFSVIVRVCGVYGVRVRLRRRSWMLGFERLGVAQSKLEIFVV